MPNEIGASYCPINLASTTPRVSPSRNSQSNNEGSQVCEATTSKVMEPVITTEVGTQGNDLTTTKATINKNTDFAIIIDNKNGLNIGESLPNSSEIASTSALELNSRKDIESNADEDDKPEIGCKRVLVNESDILELESYKRRRVNIFTEDSGPKWYDVQTRNVTQTIDPNKLIEAFDFLPLCGRPNSRAELKEFQEMKIKEFVGCGLNNDEFSDLAKSCSVDHLKNGKELNFSCGVPGQGLLSQEEVTVLDNSEDSVDGSQLCVVKKLKMRLERDAGNAYAKKLKYRGIRMIPLVQEDEGDSDQGVNLDPGKDLLFRVRIYRPFPYNSKEKVSRVRHSVFSRDVVMLGRQCLWELRERIVCPNDVDMRLDISDRIDDPPPATAKELFPSGFMFINNVFYVDSRIGCSDTTERLRQWAASKRGLGVFRTRDMAACRLHSLRVKLGHPEVYVHQGNCEHLFTFSEIRLLNSNDPLKLSYYPCHTAISQNQTVYCTTCAEFGAKWIVTGCERVPFDPAFFCDTCLRLYLYKDGQKIGEFKAYSYRGNEINMLKPQG